MASKRARSAAATSNLIPVRIRYRCTTKVEKPAVVTSNCDTFFERSLMQSYSPEFATAESAAGQDIPAPGSSRFHGIVHLHGRLSDPQLGLSQTELVLTSAQYGEAYLRAGWTRL
ncbi:SIR2 family protein [Rhizobium sullae]